MSQSVGVPVIIANNDGSGHIGSEDDVIIAPSVITDVMTTAREVPSGSPRAGELSLQFQEISSNVTTIKTYTFIFKVAALCLNNARHANDGNGIKLGPILTYQPLADIVSFLQGKSLMMRVRKKSAIACIIMITLVWCQILSRWIHVDELIMPSRFCAKGFVITHIYNCNFEEKYYLLITVMQHRCDVAIIAWCWNNGVPRQMHQYK